jgi:hypothetical protein
MVLPVIAAQVAKHPSSGSPAAVRVRRAARAAIVVRVKFMLMLVRMRRSRGWVESGFRLMLLWLRLWLQLWWKLAGEVR